MNEYLGPAFQSTHRIIGTNRFFAPIVMHAVMKRSSGEFATGSEKAQRMGEFRK